MKRQITSTLTILLSLLFLQGLSISGFSQEEKVTGKWLMEKNGTTLEFIFKYDNNGESHITKKFNSSDFTGYKIGNQVTFSLTRPAGTMAFKGDIKADEGTGNFVFSPDESFVKAIRDNGFKPMKIEGLMLSLFQNTHISYFAGLKRLGYSELSSSRLLAFIALEITPDYIGSMRNWTGEELTANELVQCAALDINENYAKQMAQAGLDLSPIDLVRFKAMDIDLSYIADMRKVGFDNLDANKVTQLKGLNITPEYVSEIRNLGFKGASLSEIVQFKALGISEKFINEIKQAGYPNLTIRELTQCKALNIDRSMIKKAKDFNDGKLPEFRRLITIAALRQRPGR